MKNIDDDGKIVASQLKEQADYTYPPWTDDEVESLKKFQEKGYFHPFTCSCGKNLVPTSAGWVCSDDTYIQDWAYRFMTDWSWNVHPFEKLLNETNS